MPQTGANTPALNAPGRLATNPWDEAERFQMRKGPKVPSGGCKIVLWRASDGWCGRGNTVAGWVEMNRAVSLHLSPSIDRTKPSLLSRRP